MKKNIVLKLSAAIFCLATASSSYALSRPQKKFGIGYGVISDPAPSLTAYQIKFNLTPALQLDGGYGKVGIYAKSYGISAKYFLISSWNFSPYVNAGYSLTKINGAFTVAGQTVNIPVGNQHVIYAGAGIDHQSNIGFNFGAGFNYFFSPSILKAKLPLLPNLYVGWFF